MVVASGMGGKDNLLRFFVALLPIASNKPLNDVQIHIVKSEFADTLQDFNAEIENEIDFMGKFPKFTMLVPMQTNPTQIISSSIKTCNELGRFLEDGAIISNVKPMDDKEIEKVWKDMRKRKNAPPPTNENDDDDEDD